MRPVSKNINSPQIFSKYGDAKPHLCRQLGKYCSYCEIELPIAALEVEHILAKDLYPTFKLNWQNFLLACKNCNSTKDRKDLRSIATFLPHLHNLLCYLEINESIIMVKPSINLVASSNAQAFIDLVGLDKIDVSSSDDRWDKRMIAFHTAIEERNEYEQHPSTRNINVIVKLAQAQGFFSVWYFIFMDFPEVRLALIQNFIGTDISCFDASNKYEPLPRFLNDGGLGLAQ